MVKFCGVLSAYVSCSASFSGGNSRNQVLAILFPKKKDVFTFNSKLVLFLGILLLMYIRSCTIQERKFLIIFSLLIVCNNILPHY